MPRAAQSFRPDPAPEPPAALHVAAGPDAALALDLAIAARQGRALLFIDATGSRLSRLAGIAQAFVPDLEVLLLPAWDSLPYDHTPPSPAVMGRRAQSLACLAEPADRPRLVLTSARAVLQRVPPPTHWRTAMLSLAIDEPIEAEALRPTLASLGYHFDEDVAEAGTVALRGRVIEVFPGGADQPVRIEVTDGRIASLHTVDPATRRSEAPLDCLVLRPVVESEPEPEQVAAEVDRMSHPDTAEREPVQTQAVASGLSASLLDYLADTPVVLHPDTAVRWNDIEAEVTEAYQAARLANRLARSGATLPEPRRLYQPAAGLRQRLQGAPVLVDEPTTAIALPRTLRDLLHQIDAAGPSARIVVAAGGEAQAIAAGLARRGVLEASVARDWDQAITGPGRVAVLPVQLHEGFARPGLHLIPARRPSGSPATSASALPLEEPPRITDILVHEEHGVCCLTGLRSVGEEERLALEFHEGTELLVPITDLDRLWRYGSAAGQVTLDRLHGEAWQRRRSEIQAQITQTAAALAATAAERARLQAPVITPDRAAFARVVERFPYPPSPDQQAAIDALARDLASGRPMNRLVCGDVGFGKTEIALRAVAAAAIAGYQVAVVAPTTVLARQHLETFRRRLAGTGLRIEPLFRGGRGAADTAIRQGLADGSVGIVIGTQALASDKLRFVRLGLVVIDEEHRFGDADKRKLSGLETRNGAVHTLVMTATPIPRTLQTAMVGLRDISVIATAPMRRQPVRTYVLPFDPILLREALLREHGRGGQSFMIAPRIEDLAHLERMVREHVPALSVATVHGRMKPEVLESRVTGFASGDCDVLLATNIIEAGLDIPRANTILITGPDRFGLAQLHQMRGRVGRGERRGFAYLLTDPGRTLAAPTLRRLHTLESMEALGAGMTVAIADLDMRGAGDLFGAAQAGHVQAIGTELYQRILAAELARLHGQAPPPPRPELHTEVAGRIPADYVPESNVRLELYRRLARLQDADAADAFVEEITDRFGAIPPPFERLICLARLQVWCAAHAVLRLDAGPKAVALTLAGPDEAHRLAPTFADTEIRDNRVLLPVALHDPVARLTATLSTLGLLG